MAEVKSTLELVMERTRHLTLTEDEKREQAVAEFKGSLGGLLQKVQDGIIGPERFKADLRTLEEGSRLSGSAMLIEELSPRLDLDGDNAWALNLIHGVFGVKTDELTAIFREYRKARDRLRETLSRQIQSLLAERHGISGSAVVPNCDAAPDWAAESGHLRERFQTVLNQALATLKMGSPG